MGPGSPFPDYALEVKEAQLTELLDSGRNNFLQAKGGCETWCCAWSPDGAYFAWSSGYRIVKLLPWNRYEHHLIEEEEQESESKVIEIDCGEPVWAVTFGSPTSNKEPHSVILNWSRKKRADDLFLATGLHSGRIRVWNVWTGRLMVELVDHKDVIRDLRFAPDGSLRLASVSRDGKLKFWDLHDDGNMYKSLTGDSKWLFGCAWSPDSKMIVTVGDCKSVILWDTCTYKRMRKLGGHNHDVTCCNFSPDGALLATASYDTTVLIWDPYKGQQLFNLGHLFPAPSPIFAGGANGSYVRGVSFCNDGRHIATISDDSFIRFWDLFNPESPVQVATVHNMLCCMYSPDGAVLAVGTRKGNVSFWLSPMSTLSLQHLCRMALRRLVPSTAVNQLDIPVKLKCFLSYLIW